MKKPLRHGDTEFSWMEILDCCRPVRSANIILKKIPKTKLNTPGPTAFCFWDFLQNDLDGRQRLKSLRTLRSSWLIPPEYLSVSVSLWFPFRVLCGLCDRLL
jgi:hypothetical protein